MFTTMTTGIPSISLVYDRKKKAGPDKNGLVEIRITYNRKQKYLSTGVTVPQANWKNGRIAGLPEAEQLNTLIETLVMKIRQVIGDMLTEDNVDIFDIPGRLERRERKNMSFISYIKERTEIRKYGKKKDTSDRYDRFLRLFAKYGKIRTFEDVTEAAVMMYDKHLESLGMTKYSKWQNYHRFLNSFINDAMADGLIRRNPYRTLNIEKDKTVKSLDRHLTPAELKRLEKTPMPVKYLERAKDVFLLQTYTCLAYTDIKNFDKSHITNIKDMPVYTGNRGKTGKRFTIPLVKKAVDILEKYDYKPPVTSNTKYNLYIKAVMASAGINKPVTSHWARHTGATMLLNMGVPLETIAKICGHSSMRITEQIYAKLLDETVVDDIKNKKR